MATLGDGFKDIFLAGIGAMAITGEKTKELVDQFIAKGEITVEQGKQINSELTHKAETVVSTVRYDMLEARMSAMTPEERAAFLAKAGEIAEQADAKAAADAKARDAAAVQADAKARDAAAVQADADADVPAVPQTPGA